MPGNRGPRTSGCPGPPPRNPRVIGQKPGLNRKVSWDRDYSYQISINKNQGKEKLRLLAGGVFGEGQILDGCEPAASLVQPVPGSSQGRQRDHDDFAEIG